MEIYIYDHNTRKFKKKKEKKTLISKTHLPISVSSSISIFSSILIKVGELLSQSYAQIKHSTIFGVKKLRNWSSTRPSILKENSYSTIDIGIDKMSCAIRERT